jgi:predicted O-methyltransferase YrrM
MPHKFHQIKHYLLHRLKASKGGHGVHSPFVYHLCEEVFYNTNPFYDFSKLNAIRADLLKNETTIDVLDLGAGSQHLSSDRRSVKEIAKHGISSAKQSELLFRLVNVLGHATIIELGTSLGLNTLYLRAAAQQARIFSLEGNPELKQFAFDLAEQTGFKDIHFLEGNFDELLPNLLEQEGHFDLLYVDGNHQYEATLRYFNLALKYKHQHSVIVFDDIYWSPEMTRAWQDIQKHPSVKLSLDLFHLGIVFFREEIKEKQNLRLVV